MALLGRWTGGVIGTMMPSASWAAPNGLFPTQARNDSSTYTWASTTSIITIPATGLPDGYMLRASIETEDSSNGRLNIQGKFVQASGTGNFVSTQTSGFSRDNSEDRAFLQVTAIVDNPSASATFQFQWKRDTDVAGASDGTVNSTIEIIPLYYSNIGMYESTTAAALAGTTPNTVNIGGSTPVYESDTAAIQLASNVVTVKGDNKRYMIIGSIYGEGWSNNIRTQRTMAFKYNSVVDDATRSYCYIRQTSCDNNGTLSWDLYETVTTNIPIELNAWIGDAYSADNGGGEATHATVPSVAHNSLVVIELNDSADVFRSHDATGLQSDTAGTPVDLNAARTLDFNDAASFTSPSNTVINAEQAMDALVAGNVYTARANITNTTRRTTRGHITVNGVEDVATADGTYSRGDQSTTGTAGGGFQPGGFIALALNDDIGMSQTAITGTEAGNPRTFAGGVGLWGINLDTMAAPTNGISAIVPSTFNMVNTDIDIDGLNFTATETTDTVYISDANTLAGSVNEVDITNAVNTWSDTQINLNLSLLSAAELQSLHTLKSLDPDASMYIIVLTSGSDEYASSAVTMTRPPAIEMVAGAATPGSTTSRLTGMSGTFGGGRIEEAQAQNPSTTTVDVADDGYREDVWSIQLTPEAVDLGQYEFRLKVGGVVLDTITQTPKLTQADGAINLSATGLGVSVNIGDASLTIGGLNLSSSSLSVPLGIGTGVLSIGAVSLNASALSVPISMGDASLNLGAVSLAASSFTSPVLFGDASLTPGELNLSSTSLEISINIGSGGFTLGAVPLTATSLSVNVNIGAGSLSLGAVNLAGTSLSVPIAIGDASIYVAPQNLSSDSLAVSVSIGNASYTLGTVSLSATGLVVNNNIGVANLTIGAVNLSSSSENINITVGDATITGDTNLSASSVNQNIEIGDATLTIGAVNLSANSLAVPVAYGNATIDGDGSISASALEVNVDIGNASLTIGSVLLAATSLEVSVDIGDASAEFTALNIASSSLEVPIAIGNHTLTQSFQNLSANGLDIDIEIGSASLTIGAVNLSATALEVPITIGSVNITGALALSSSSLVVPINIGDATTDSATYLQATGLEIPIVIRGGRILDEISASEDRCIDYGIIDREIIIESMDRTITIDAMDRTIDYGEQERTIEIEDLDRTIFIGK